MTSKKQILLMGDISIDWHVTKQRREDTSLSYWHQMEGNITSSPGGVMLLRQLIINCLDCEVNLRENTYDYSNQYSDQTVMLCTPFSKDKNPRNTGTAIRIESLSGLKTPLKQKSFQINNLSSNSPQIVVIDDAGLGIRVQPDEILNTIEQLPKLENGEEPLVILKVAWPILDNPLLISLAKMCGDKLIVICPIDDLRRDKLQISRGLSWEQTAQDISWEYNYNPRMKIFSEIKSLIIPIGLAGAWISNNYESNESFTKTEPLSSLVFDPSGIEGDWEKQHPGMILGNTSCFTLGILQSFAKNEGTDIIKASCCGLSAMRSLHLNGYQINPETREVYLPFNEIKKSLENPALFPAIEVPLGHRHYSVPAGKNISFKTTPEWSILKEITGHSTNMLKLAIDIVRKGTSESLGNIPFAKFGGLTTVDRNEIEAFRTTHDLIFDYCNKSSNHRPLSIAVFGPPGSGKSFGIAQVAKAVAGENIEKITFNVSQFSSQIDFIDALHRVRDIGLTGKVPLVFWDEFDSSLNGEPLAWLKVFLAPMQDGEFSQGQITHPIGRAIFVFAGSTVSNLEEFEIKFDNQSLRAAKVPDFKSRLRGCINMVGIDRVKKIQSGVLESDPQYVVRRAIILRSIIERVRPDVISKNKDANIDYGLLKALLSVWSYKHGVRSLESIVELCHLGDAGILHRSSLPPQNVLTLHVNSNQFLGLITSDVEFHGATLEILASANHEMYCEESPDSPLSKLNYAELSEVDKEKNRGAVKGIPYKLASIHFLYKYITNNDSDESDTLTDEEIEFLAKIEHDRWIVDKIDDGYIYGEQKNEKRFPMTHPDLVPWDNIDSKEIQESYPEIIALKLGPGPLKNNVDKELARQIPEILRRANYCIKRI
jgi:hypothetical protein